MPRQAWIPIRHAQRNKGMTQEFEQLGRTIVATGCSERHARHTLLLAGDYLLNTAEAANFKKDLPTTHWFATQREAVGNESFVYACLQIAACDKVIQWGFDETSLDGQPTFNQWCLVESGESVQVVNLECAGIYPRLRLKRQLYTSRKLGNAVGKLSQWCGTHWGQTCKTFLPL